MAAKSRPPAPKQPAPLAQPPPPMAPVRDSAPLEEEEMSEGSSEKEEDGSSITPEAPQTALSSSRTMAGSGDTVGGPSNGSAEGGSLPQPAGRPSLAGSATLSVPAGRISSIVVSSRTVNPRTTRQMPLVDVIEGVKDNPTGVGEGGLGAGFACLRGVNAAPNPASSAPQVFDDLPQRPASRGTASNAPWMAKGRSGEASLSSDSS